MNLKVQKLPLNKLMQFFLILNRIMKMRMRMTRKKKRMKKERMRPQSKEKTKKAMKTNN